jgi:hypothetical protein
MKPLRFHPHWLCVMACSTGLSCAALFSPITAPPGAHASPQLAQAVPGQKASPYAAAQDESKAEAAGQAQDTLDKLKGTKAAGSQKDSPFAAAKESDAATSAHLRVHRMQLWWLLLPVGLAAVSYGALRSKEDLQGS